jgi:ribosome biogenesis protein MAK21
VYKNPKKIKSEEDDGGHVGPGRLGKGASAMQPAASGVEGVKLIKGEIGYVGGELVNEKAFLTKKRTSVPIDQVFFYDYFTRKHEKEKALAAKAKRKGKDVDEGEDEDDERDGHEAGSEVVEKSGDDWDEDEDGDAKEEEIWKVFIRSLKHPLYFLLMCTGNES